MHNQHRGIAIFFADLHNLRKGILGPEIFATAKIKN